MQLRTIAVKGDVVVIPLKVAQSLEAEDTRVRVNSLCDIGNDEYWGNASGWIVHDGLLQPVFSVNHPLPTAVGVKAQEAGFQPSAKT